MSGGYLSVVRALANSGGRLVCSARSEVTVATWPTCGRPLCWRTLAAAMQIKLTTPPSAVSAGIYTDQKKKKKKKKKKFNTSSFLNLLWKPPMTITLAHHCAVSPVGVAPSARPNIRPEAESRTATLVERVTLCCAMHRLTGQLSRLHRAR